MKDDCLRLLSDSELISLHAGRLEQSKGVVVTLQPNLRTIVNQDGAAILDTKAGRISTLNSSGAYVWQALERGDEIEAIAEGLSRQTGEPIESVKRDLVDFVEALKEQNLLLN